MRFDRVADLSVAEREALRELTRIVYPPAVWDSWPGHAIEWAKPEWCVRTFAEDGSLASHVGIVLRDATHDGQPVRIGGLGGVKTHPDARGRGYARLGLQRAVEFFAERGVAFGLLVCEPHLMEYYASLGWREFAGKLLVRQHGAEVEFTFIPVMTRAGPTGGVIDLGGPAF